MIPPVELSSALNMNQHVYIGIKSSVICLDKHTGTEIWKTELKSSEKITLTVTDDVVVAYAHGELFGIAKNDGRLLWSNNLPGLGYGHCSIATDTPAVAKETKPPAPNVARQTAIVLGKRTTFGR